MADSTKCIDRGECRGGKCIPFCETQDLQVRSINIYTGYGNTGGQVFKRRVQNWKDFCLNINIAKGNFENC